jgi:hypothetical protein
LDAPYVAVLIYKIIIASAPKAIIDFITLNHIGKGYNCQDVSRRKRLPYRLEGSFYFEQVAFAVSLCLVDGK